MSKQSNFLEGIIVGAILGGIAGVLFAPSPGEETRKKLKSMAAENSDLVDSAKDQTEDLIDKTKDAIEQGFSKIKTLIEENKATLKADDLDRLS